MKASGKKSSILAALIWIVSIILSFKIPPSNGLIWLPDTLLLLGFYPLFVSARSLWLWIGFGLINLFIGVMLLLGQVAPEEELLRLGRLFHLQVLEMRANVLSYHPYYIWAIIGILSMIIGLALLLFKFSLWVFHYFSKSK